jgi:hypothetical protein
MPRGSYLVLLQVFDDTGLRDTDTAWWVVDCSSGLDLVVFDFEVPDYVPGSLLGQAGWTGVHTDGAATVIDTDNGPSLPGWQCVSLSDATGRIKAQRGLCDLLAGPNRLLTLQYDFRLAEGSDDAFMLYPEVPPGMRVGVFPSISQMQWYGTASPLTGDPQGYSGDTRASDRNWHTIQWRVYFGDRGAGEAGAVLDYWYDGARYPRDPDSLCYMVPGTQPTADLLSLMLDDVPWATSADEVRIDNIIIRSKPVVDLGACCLPDGTCQDLVEADCAVQYGQFSGIGIECLRSWNDRPVVCPLPQACCFHDGHCEEIIAAPCSLRGGMPAGDGILCAAAICTGACCRPDGGCTDTSPPDCAAIGGLFTGSGTQCWYTGCPQPGWCCLPVGCVLTLENLCQQQGGTAGGPGTTCAEVACAPNDACASAIAVAIPSVLAGDATHASVDPVPVGCCHNEGGDFRDVWYTLAGNGADITISMCGGESWDSRLAVYTGTCGDLDCVACNDDFCGGGPGSASLSQVTFASIVGTSYVVRVFGGTPWPAPTAFTLTISSSSPPSGACCVHSACTSDIAEAGCLALGGIYQGGGTACAPTNPCPVCAGDANCDGKINFDDINCFVAALAGGHDGWASYYSNEHGANPPPCTFANNDTNGSGSINFDDINPFVSLLVAVPRCP